jgi:hypothetical protein
VGNLGIPYIDDPGVWRKPNIPPRVFSGHDEFEPAKPELQSIKATARQRVADLEKARAALPPFM